MIILLSDMAVSLVPSVLVDDASRAADQLAFVRLHTKRVQLDVCDGSFVFRRSLADFSKLDFSGLEVEYHLMVSNPVDWLERLPAPASVICHVELSAPKVEAFLAGCQKRGIFPALGINPETPVCRLAPYLSRVNRVTVLGVHPGWQDQEFLPFVLSKVRALSKSNQNLQIQLDGGMQLSPSDEASSLFQAVQAGASSVILGSALWKASSREDVLSRAAKLAATAENARLSQSPPLTEFEKRIFLKSYQLRSDVIAMVTRAHSGHIGGALGLAEVFAVLFERMHLDPKNPRDPGRDRLLVSNGHIGAIWYASLARAGFFGIEELSSFRQLDSRLQGHPHNSSLPGIENSGGPLAQGLSQAVGRCLALRLSRSPARVYCIIGDGEINEGQAWEAFLSAAKFRLNQLTFLLDRNGIQIDDYSENVLPLEPLADKLRAFNIHPIEIDAHDPNEIVRALDEAAAFDLGPSVIVCHSTPGKGVSFFEGDFKWHGTPPSIEQAMAAKMELDNALQRIGRGQSP